jgi:hypothetical protein
VNECAGICRTPGFWGTHPIETQTLLTASTGITVCGVPVQAYDDCAAEGLCNTPRGDQQLILARHLLATALNCYLTNGNATCGAGELGTLFNSCNAACASGNPAAMGTCSAQLDCYNNGGQWVGGKCAIGTCSVSGAYCGANYPGCPVDQVCNNFAGNCHDRLLNGGIGLLSEPPNPANPDFCQAATRSSNTIFTLGVCPQ